MNEILRKWLKILLAITVVVVCGIWIYAEWCGVSISFSLWLIDGYGLGDGLLKIWDQLLFCPCKHGFPANIN